VILAKPDRTTGRDKTSGQATPAVLSLPYLMVVPLGEVATFYVDATTGILVSLAILLGLLAKSAISRDERWSGLWLALGLVPITRIASLAIHPAGLSDIYRYVLVSIPILAGAIAVLKTLGYGWREAGIRTSEPVVQGLMILVGSGLGLLDFFILRPGGLNSSLSFQSTLVPAIVMMVSTGFVEELVFRGVIQRAAGAISSRGWVYVAVVYAALQIGRGSLLHVGMALAMSLYFGWIVRRTGSIVGVSLAHGMFNVALYLIAPHII
jgi:membrane protease YdiL (CAAX protease family)